MSGEITGRDIDLLMVSGEGTAAETGVVHSDVLIALAEAQVGDDDSALALARGDVVEKVGPAGLVDAVAVVANFERMVRIADATGIPLDGSLEAMSDDIRSDLDLGRFASAANTPESGPLVRTLRGGLRRILRPALPLIQAARTRLNPR